MQFVSKVQQFVSGKTDIERKQEQAANEVIRKKAIVAQLKERERQAIKFGMEKEKVAYERRMKALREPPKPMYQSPIGGGQFANILGSSQPVEQRAVTRRTIRTREVPIRKGKKIVGYKRVSVKQKRITQPKVIQPQPYRII
jgi:hypothetical protein